MERTKVVRGLRIAVSAVCGVLCALLVVLWVRSYFTRDEIAVPFGKSGLLQVQSHPGRLVPSVLFDSGSDTLSRDYYPWFVGSQPHRTHYRQTLDSVLAGFGVSISRELTEIELPYWFLAFLAAAVVPVPWIGQLRWRFSLRTLLIATTLIAVVLGLVTVLNC